MVKKSYSSNDKEILAAKKVASISTDISELLAVVPKLKGDDFKRTWRRIRSKVHSQKRLARFATDLICVHDFKLIDCSNDEDTFTCSKCDKTLYWVCIDQWRMLVRNV
jgi:hypothetical protein